MRLGRWLGQGAFGEVYQATYHYRPGVDIPIARKAVLGTTVDLSGVQQYEAFEWEVRRMASVQHPNIVRMYGYHQENSQLYLDMEYCAGGTLEQLLEKERLSLAQCWQIALDLAHGLAYLEHKGIVHRDLKPDNIFLDEQGRAKLADLGIAQVDILVQANEAKKVTGMKAKGWAAPEEYIAKAASRSASDCYSFGLIMWYMMTGKNPLQLPEFKITTLTRQTFQARLAALDNAIRAEREKRTPEELPLYDLICTNLLAQNPASRMTAKMLIADLEQLAFLHPQGLYLKMSQVTSLLVEEQRETLLDYIPLQVTASPLQEDSDKYWERREKESMGNTPEGDAPQALERNFDRFLADPGVPVLVLFGEGGLGKSLSTYQLAQRLIKVRQIKPTRQDESKTEAPFAVQIKHRYEPPTPEPHYHPEASLVLQEHLYEPPARESHYHPETSLVLQEHLYEPSARESHYHPEPNPLALDDSAPVAVSVSSHEAPALVETLATSGWLPIFIRPGIAEWAHSELHQGIQTCLKTYYQLNEQTIKNLRHAHWLFILDGYDELSGIPFENLPEQLGLSSFPNAKLIVTSRHSAIKAGEEAARFGLEGALTTYYLLPLPLNTLLAALEERLGWQLQQKEDCAKRLQESPSLRVALRNPFVLNLFVQSWDTLAQEDFNKLSRVGIYEGFIRHWLTSQQDLLAPLVKQLLHGMSLDLVTSFYLLAETLAFDAYKQNTLLLKAELYLDEKTYPWLHLHTLINTAAAAEFEQREKSVENKNRALLTIDDYMSLMRAKGADFMLLSPLQQRGNTHWNFVHKSFYEYFVARFLLHLSSEPDFKSLAQCLNSRNIQEEPGIIDFIAEISQGYYNQAAFASLEQKLLELIPHSAKDQTLSLASSNAATILNRCNVSLSYQNWAGVQLPGADLSYALLAHSDLSNANLQKANLAQGIFYEANLEGADLRDVRWGEYPRLQMKEKVQAIAHHPTKPWIAIAQGSTIVLKNRETDTVIGQPMAGHTSRVTSVAFSPEGSISWPQEVRIIPCACGTVRRDRP